MAHAPDEPAARDRSLGTRSPGWPRPRLPNRGHHLIVQWRKEDDEVVVAMHAYGTERRVRRGTEPLDHIVTHKPNAAPAKVFNASGEIPTKVRRTDTRMTGATAKHRRQVLGGRLHPLAVRN